MHSENADVTVVEEKETGAPKMDMKKLEAALSGYRSRADNSSDAHQIATAGIGDRSSPFSSWSGKYSDKSATGFCGIYNQGATCYMNAFLQTLFMTPEMRRAVYEFKYEPDPKITDEKKVRSD